jgi:CHAT domain-containing protein
VKLIRTILLLLVLVVGVAVCAGDRLSAMPQAVAPPNATATDVEGLRRDAEHDMAEALRLRQAGTAESLNAAAAAFERAVTKWRIVADRAQLAAALRGLGVIHRMLGRTKESVTELTEAVSLLTDAGQRAAALGDLASSLFVGGDSHRALDMYEASLVVLREVHDQVSEAKVLNNIGAVTMNLGENHRAIEAYKESLAKADPSDLNSRGNTLGNLSAAYANIGDISTARDYLAQSLAIRQQSGDKRGLAATLYLLGNVEQGYGDPQKALGYLKTSVDLRRATGDRSGEAYSVQTLGSAYVKLGELGAALESYDQARRIRHDIGNRNDEADTLMHIADAHERLGEHAAAIENAEQALRLMQQVANPRGEGGALVVLGELARAGGDGRRALEYLDRALPITRATDNPDGEMRASGTAGAAHIDLGEPAAALEGLRHAVMLAQQSGDRFAEVEWLFETARAHARLGDLVQARADADRTVSAAEAVRSGLAGADFRARYFATVRNAYDLLIDTLMRFDAEQPGRGFRETALEVSERARARSLLDLLSESHVDVREGIDADLLKRERALESSLAAKTQAVVQLRARSHSEAEAAATGRELDALTTALRELEAEIRLRSPRYAALTQPTITTLTDVQRSLLDDDTVLVEFDLGEERSYVWLVTRTSVDARPLPGRAVVEAAVRRVYRLVSVNDSASSAAVTRGLSDLHTLLIGSMPAIANARRVVVVPDGALEYLPFGALLNPAGRPLLSRSEVITLPSASTLATLRGEATRSRAPKFIAAIADPVFDDDDPRVARHGAPPHAADRAEGSGDSANVQRSASEAGLERLERLRFSRREADVIRTLVPSDQRLTALDFDARRETMLDPALGDYRIVHIATHGLINSRHPELSGLVLSLVDSQGRAQDGFVKSYELYKLKLNADLVVLSACQTALGEQIRGEGLISLTRPFMYAGVPRVVASLWEVPDRASATLMDFFYQGIVKDHLSPAAALRRAQLKLRETPRWSSP